MKIQSIKTVYFSATGNTKNVVKLIGETIARNMNLSYKEIDFTPQKAALYVAIFTADIGFIPSWILFFIL